MRTELEELAWLYARTDDFEGFKQRLMSWIEARDYDDTAHSTKAQLKATRYSFIHQRQNGYRKDELNSEYWDKVIDYLAHAYYGERSGRISTTNLAALNRPIDEWSRDIQRIVWRFSASEDVEGAEKTIVGFVRPYLTDTHIFKLSPVFQLVCSNLKVQRKKPMYREKMASIYWDRVVESLETVTGNPGVQVKGPANRTQLSQLFEHVLQENRQRLNVRNF